MNGECTHHPGLKRPTASWDTAAIPPTPRIYQVAIRSPDGCPECLQERVRTLRRALADASHLAIELMRHPCELNHKDATERLTAALASYYADLRDWGAL